MFARDILKIYAFSYNWLKLSDEEVVVENFYTKRKVYLKDELAFLWELIVEDSSFASIKAKFLEKYNEKILKRSLKKLKSCGIIKIE